MTFMFTKLVTFIHPNRVLSFLVVFRWASLIPVLLTLSAGNQPHQLLPPVLVFGVALLANLFISLANRQLNQLVIDHPALISVDLVFSAGILATSGGAHSPYYLYALSPLLAGAFFFQTRGALIASMVFTPLYSIGSYLNSQAAAVQTDLIVLTTQLAGIWLIPILFAYPAILLKDINQAREELSTARDELAQKHENLENAHRQLEIIHDLTVLLQAAPDLISVQERVLGAVTTDLGFSKAVVAMVDPAREEIGGWLVYPPDESFPQIAPFRSNPKMVRSSRLCSAEVFLQATTKPSFKIHNSITGSIKINGSWFRFICGNTPSVFYWSKNLDSPTSDRIH